MRLGYWFLAVLVFSSATARAGGYDAFVDGMSAINYEENERAIADFTAAIAAGDLNANLVPVAYVERARLRLAKGECAEAVADTTAALKLKPSYFEAHVYRASAIQCLGNYADAVADFSAVIAARPSASDYWGRGLMRWSSGDFDASADDFSSAASLSPKWAYPVLWFGLTKLRAGTLDAGDFAKRSDDFAAGDWPAPVFGLYEGKVKPEDVLDAAKKGDAETAKKNLCEARFYVAEWWLVQKNADTAKPLLRDALSSCPRNFVEYFGAFAELKRLK